jgi:hypothetical protein
MKSNEVGTTLKHPETINGNVKNLSKRMKMKDKGEHHFYFKGDVLLYLSFSSFYFKNLILPLTIRAGIMEGVETSLNKISKAK